MKYIVVLSYMLLFIPFDCENNSNESFATVDSCESEYSTKDVGFTACNENSFLFNDAGGLILERYGQNLTFYDTSVIFKNYGVAEVRGIQYADTGYVKTPRTLTDKRYVDNAINYISILSSDPTNAKSGFLYYNSSLQKLRLKIGNSWITL